jgi:hypothetical protein
MFLTFRHTCAPLRQGRGSMEGTEIYMAGQSRLNLTASASIGQRRIRRRNSEETNQQRASNARRCPISPRIKSISLR